MKKLAVITNGSYLIKDLNNNLITFESLDEAKSWLKSRSIKNYKIVCVTIY